MIKRIFALFIAFLLVFTLICCDRTETEQTSGAFLETNESTEETTRKKDKIELEENADTTDFCVINGRMINFVPEEELKKLPKLDSTVSTKDGKGYVSEVSPLTGIVRVKFVDNDSVMFRSYPAEDVKVVAPPKKGGKGYKGEKDDEE